MSHDPGARRQTPVLPSAALKKLLAAVVTLAVVLLNLDLVVLLRAMPEKPDVGTPRILSEAVEVQPDGSKRLGPCWWREHRGQHVMYVEGDAFTLGYCNSKLAGEVMVAQERALHDGLDVFVPLRLLQHVLIRSIMAIYRDMPRHFTPSERREVLGIARGYRDPFREKGPTYARILSYHAIHDISQALIDNPLIACTAFAASGPATADGHTLMGRNFDFEGGRVFDDDKVVIFYRPEHGVPFVSVVWAGMVGSVSGMNTEGIAITLNAAGSDDGATQGTPNTLLVRQVLQYAHSLDDAIAILSAREVFVTDIFTVADGETGEVAIVERTPGRIAVRRDPHLVGATNHLREPAFADDEENGKRIREGTTGSRGALLDILLRDLRGKLDPATAVSILRDRKVGEGEVVGLGHRGTIDALIAAHSVVFDATTLRLWVSTPPHTLGEFVEYDLREVLGGKLEDRGALPADPLAGEGWARYEAAQKKAREATLALRADDYPTARAAAEAALELAPDHPPALRMKAEACAGVGDEACMRATWERYLAQHPPYAKYAREAKEALGR